MEEEPVEKSPYQPPVSQRPSVIVDTDNEEINENASRAAEATDDPESAFLPGLERAAHKRGGQPVARCKAL